MAYMLFFKKSIPAIITNWLGPFIEQFLMEQELYTEQLHHFIAHPGGKKVLKAYEDTLYLAPQKKRHFSGNIKKIMEICHLLRCYMY